METDVAVVILRPIGSTRPSEWRRVMPASAGRPKRCAKDGENFDAPDLGARARLRVIGDWLQHVDRASTVVGARELAARSMDRSAGARFHPLKNRRAPR